MCTKISCLRGRVSYKPKTESHTAPAYCPPETGGTRSEATEGVDLKACDP